MQRLVFLLFLSQLLAVEAAPVIRVSVRGDADHRSIQAAVDAAPPGAVIEVAAGTYRENIAIAKSVRLKGAGWNRTRVELPGNTEPTIEATWNKLLDELERMPPAEREARLKTRMDFRLENKPLFISGTNEVGITGMGFHWVGPKVINRAVLFQLVEITNATVTLRDVAVLGSPDTAVVAYGGASLTMDRCLVAGNWGRGVQISSRDSTAKFARITNCDLRHNHRSHISIHAESGGIVSGCRLYGTAFFAIRPYSTNLVIAGNAIFNGARSAFYCVKSDVLITNNLIFNHEFGGVISWDGNRDRIVNNTFANNAGYGIASIGTATPRLAGNIFYGHDSGLHSSRSSLAQPEAPSGEFEFVGQNLFYKNGTNWTSLQPDVKDPKINVATSPTPTKLATFDPGFVDATAGDFRLRPDSPAQGFGAVGFPSLQSPFPLQPEEQAIIPDSKSFSFQGWKEPAKPDTKEFYNRLMAIVSQAKRPKVGYEAAFRDLYETLGKRYPNFELKNIDWRAVGERLLPRAAKVKNDREFGLLCHELVARLEDSHAFVGKGLIEPPTVEYPLWDTGYACLLDERGETVVYHVTPGSPAAGKGVQPGMTVVSLNGRPARKVLDEAAAGYRIHGGFSSERLLRYQAARWFTRVARKDAPVVTVMRDVDGREHTFDLTANQALRYLPRLPVPNPPIDDSAGVSWKMLDGNIGLIYVRRIRGDLLPQLDQAVADLKNAKGLMVDVRGNSGGGFDYQRAHLNFTEDRSKEPERPRFTGPMALLIDSRCISAGEGWASWFIANQRARVFGSATAGASARKTTYTLKNELFKVTFPVKAYRGYLDRAIERRGLEPDVPLRQSAKDLALGRDTVLEAAREYLLGRRN